MSELERLGKYTLRGTLGKGAMGTVYDGWDPGIAREVAIKTIRLPSGDDAQTEEEYARFKREAQAAGKLNHPGIIAVYDSGEENGLAYIVMERVHGRSLKALLDAEHRLTPGHALTVMQELLAALSYSHGQGVIHRDIKPTNILLTEAGRVKIADFGIARIESSSMTQLGTVMGTPAYMSPEQFMGQAVDARTDVYAAGVLLYQLLTGERPFEGGITAIMHKVLHTVPPRPSELSVTAPPALDPVVAQAMARRPEDRYESASAFATALTHAVAAYGVAPAADPADDATVVMVPPAGAMPASFAPAGRSPAGRAPPRQTSPDTAAAPVSRTQRRAIRPILAAGAGAGALVLAGGAAWVLLRPGSDAGPAPLASLSAPADVPVVPPVQPTPVPVVVPMTNQAPPEPATAAPPPVAPPAAPPPVTPPAAPPPVTPPAAPPPVTPPAAPPPVIPPAAPPLTVAIAPTIEAPGATPLTPIGPPIVGPGARAPTMSNPLAPPTAASAAPSASLPADQPVAVPDAPGRPLPGPTPPIVAFAPDLTPLATTLAAIPCTAIDIDARPAGIAATGAAGIGVAEEAAQAALARSGIPVTWQVARFDGPYCPVIDLARTLRGPAKNDFQFTLRRGQRVFADHETIAPVIVTPGFPSYLRLSYFQQDGSVSHLAATPSGTALPGRAAVPLGDKDGGWEAGPPFGTDVMLAVLSSIPLKLDMRPGETGPAGPYIAAVSRAAEAARRAGATVIARAMIVTTHQ